MKSGSQSVGHPVDVATGVVHDTYSDIVIGGRIALEWSRFYSTALNERTGPLGFGWTNKYFCTLEFEGGRYVFTGADGSPVTLEDPHKRVVRGEVVRNPGAFTELWFSDDNFFVCQWDVESGEIWRYLFAYEKVGERGRISPLREIQDPTGQGLELAYDEQQRLAEIRQTLERRSLLLRYGRRDLIESVEFQSADKSTRQTVVSYRHDAAGRLASATDAADFTDYFEYDGENRIQREAPKGGAVFTFRYDDKGRCVRTRGLNGYDEKTLRYIDAADWTEVTDSLGHVRRFNFNGDRQIVREINPLGAEFRTEYDSFGRIVGKTDPYGATVRYEYDEAGDRSATISALGHVSRTSYNDSHQPLTFTNSADNAWKLRYDERNRLLETENPEGERYRFGYDRDGNPIEIVDPLDNRLRLQYSPHGVLQVETDREGNAWRYRVDERGRPVAIVDPVGHETRYAYDPMGNLRLVEFADGTRATYEYDSSGNLVGHVDRDEHKTLYKYGPCHQLLSRIDPLGKSLSFTWSDEPERLLSVVNAKGETYRFEYDPNGNIVEEVGFDGRELTFEYDKLGNRVATTNALGQRVEYHRDELGRLVGQSLPDGKKAKFAYDAAGLLESAVDSNSELRFERDAVGRIVGELQNGFRIERRFDSLGNVTRVRSSLGIQADFSFDGNNLLKRMQVDGYPAMTLERDARGSEVRRRLPGQVELQQSRDELGRLTSQLAVSRFVDTSAPDMASADAVIERSYRYENARLAAVNDAQWGATEYVHDPASRLTAVLRARGASEHFQFDDNGNVTRVDLGADSVSLDYLPGDRLQRMGKTTYQYDAQGRLICKSMPVDDGTLSEWRYEWDYVDQLRAMTDPDGRTWSYAYDLFGRRIEKLAPDGTRNRFVWDGDVVLHELHDEDVKASWIFDPGSFHPLAQIEGGEFYSIVTDQLGTPRELLDKDGRIAWQVTHTAFGRVSREHVSRVSCPIRFQGQWNDEESGLHYNRFRYYDPETARYISSDPIGIAGGYNQHVYVLDFLACVDPFGLSDSGILDRNLGGSVGDQRQAHHLIPVQVWKENQALFDATGMERNHADNGLHMPSSESIRGNDIAHVGSHPRYNELVGGEVENIGILLAAEKITPGQAKTLLQDIQTDMRAKIKAKDPSIETKESNTSTCKLA